MGVWGMGFGVYTPYPFARKIGILFVYIWGVGVCWGSAGG